jgi:hypothetical protein
MYSITEGQRMQGEKIKIKKTNAFTNHTCYGAAC